MLELPSLPGYDARFVPGMQARKAYVCPDCGNTIPPGMAHVVAWRAGEPDTRRHWHRHCWRMAARRGRIA